MLARKKKFTLVELIIVTAIALIIISLLSPAIQSTIRTANNVACASNLKSLGILFETFADDHESGYLDNENLFKKNRFGGYEHTGPMMRRSFRGWPSDLKNYDNRIVDKVYCPEDKTTSAINRSSSRNANVSYEFKSVLIDLSRNTYKSSVRKNQFGLPARQSLLMSRGTFHSEKVTSHHGLHDFFAMHNIYFIDGHVSIDFGGYNHPNIKSSNISWIHYPVYSNNKKARGNDNYLEERCEIDENSI